MSLELFKGLTTDRIAALSPAQKDAMLREAIEHRERTAAHIKKLNKEAGDYRVELKAYKEALADPENGEVPTPADLKANLRWNDPDETDPGSTGADEPDGGGEARKPRTDAENTPGAVDSSAPAEADPSGPLALALVAAGVRREMIGDAVADFLGTGKVRMSEDGKKVLFDDLELTNPTIKSILGNDHFGAVGAGWGAPRAINTEVPARPTHPSFVTSRREIAPGVFVSEVDTEADTRAALKGMK